MIHTAFLIAIVLGIAVAGCSNRDSGSDGGKAPRASEMTTDPELAELTRKAEAGDPLAQFKLGLRYQVGDGVPRDSDKATEWFKKAAEQGNADAQFELGNIYEGWKVVVTATAIQKLPPTEKGVPEDIAKALEWYQKAAEQGNASAQFRLGVMHGDGKGVTKDATKAVEWFRKAAEQGHVNAQNYLGVMYANGEGVPKDATKAVEWYRKAAEQGDTTAQVILGEAYRNGEGVPKDATKAVEWYRKAAEQGNAFAQGLLGWMYDGGEGVSKDATKAVEWYRKAAEQGNAIAQLNLGASYANGEGVPKDATKAVEWYRKAAEQGFPEAQGALGWRYAYGTGTAKDKVLAYVWSNLAAASGVPLAGTLRDLIERDLSQTELQEAQRIASNWKPGQPILREGHSTSAVKSDGVGGTPTKQGTGTVFIVGKAGQAITNRHVIAGCTTLRVEGRDGTAKVVTDDKVNDLALLQVPGEIKVSAPIATEPQKLRQGEDVVVFGYPLNAVLSSGGNLTPGVVSALTGLGNNTNQIQITAPIQPGSSGSPVMNRKGEVVGVVSMKLSDKELAKATGQVSQNVNFAVNGQTLKTFLDTNKVAYRTGGGWFSFQKSTADLADEAREWTLIVECWK